MTTYSVIIGSPPDGSTLPSGTFGSLGWLIKASTPAERLNIAFRFGKPRQNIEIGTDEGEIFDIRDLSRIGPNADFQIGKLVREIVAPRLRITDLFVEIDDEQRHVPPDSIVQVTVSGPANALRPARGPCRDRARCWPIADVAQPRPPGHRERGDRRLVFGDLRHDRFLGAVEDAAVGG